jgi:hypothetical protein
MLILAVTAFPIWLILPEVFPQLAVQFASLIL